MVAVILQRSVFLGGPETRAGPSGLSDVRPGRVRGVYCYIIGKFSNLRFQAKEPSPKVEKELLVDLGPGVCWVLPANLGVSGSIQPVKLYDQIAGVCGTMAHGGSSLPPECWCEPPTLTDEASVGLWPPRDTTAGLEPGPRAPPTPAPRTCSGRGKALGSSLTPAQTQLIRNLNVFPLGSTALVDSSVIFMSRHTAYVILGSGVFSKCY